MEEREEESAGVMGEDEEEEEEEEEEYVEEEKVMAAIEEVAPSISTEDIHELCCYSLECSCTSDVEDLVDEAGGMREEEEDKIIISGVRHSREVVGARRRLDTFFSDKESDGMSEEEEKEIIVGK